MRRNPGYKASYARRLTSLSEAPERLHRAMALMLEPDSPIKLLILGPPQRLLDRVHPATLTAIFDRRWIVASDPEGGQPELCCSSFSDTLIVQMTEVLLYGLLRIEYIGGGLKRSVAIQYNTVMHYLYQEAVQTLLGGMMGGSSSASDQRTNLYRTLSALPLKFQNALVKHLPTGADVLGFVYWPAVVRKELKFFRRELAPAGVLALTRSQLIFISEEKPWSRRLSDVGYKYGYVVTHCPLARVKGVELLDCDPFGAINAKAATRDLGMNFEIAFPREQKAAVQELVNLMSFLPLPSVGLCEGSPVASAQEVDASASTALSLARISLCRGQR